MRGLILTLGVLVFACGSTYANWMGFNSGCSEGSSPSIRFGEATAVRITFDVELSGLLSNAVQHDSDDYLRFNTSPGSVVLERTGFPEVPHVTCFVAVPDGVDLDLSYTRTCLETISSLPVYPAPLDSLVHEEGITFIKEFFRKDPVAYSSTEWYPSETAEIVGEFRLRDQRVAIVDVCPVQYLASEDSLRVWGDVSIEVSFGNGNPVWSQAGLGYYDRLIGDRLIGYQPDPAPLDMTPSPGTVFRHENTLSPPSITPDYVIIVAPGLDGQFVDDFASYRASLNGFDVLIANIEDIIAGYNSPDPHFVSPGIIRDYTEALWNWSSPGDRPTYLLLIGDHDYSGLSSYSYCLPSRELGSTEGEANDDWLVLFDEPRQEFSGFPDMIVGRLPARNTDQLQDMFDLITQYESGVTPPYPGNLQNRRNLVRLAGTDHHGEFTSDEWEPSVEWTSALNDWLGYTLYNYYCGDGENTWHADPPNPDGSKMTSEDWVNACIKVFERGSQVAFYVDHGDFHMFSAGLNWLELEESAHDSTFNDDTVNDLVADPDHWFPFVLMLCCSSGTFNHTEDEHESINEHPCLCYKDTRPSWDFMSDCLAENFILNTDCGAIGVFAGSNSSSTGSYKPYGEGILSAVFEKGITRTGDAIMSSRIRNLDYFYNEGVPETELAQFNLLGDPALDIGDRMKFRDHCDLIVCPEDISINEYPTMHVNSTSKVILSATIRNAGWRSAGPFTVTMEVSEGTGIPQILTSQCSGLAAGEETEIEFVWNNSWFTPPGTLHLEVSAADPGGQTPDSWIPNNSAETDVYVEDFYPNESGWPISIGESVRVPPVLCDFDGNPSNGLEIVLATRYKMLVFDDESPSSPIWESDIYPFFTTRGRSLQTSIPVTGNIIGNNQPEIVIDCTDELLVYNSTSTDPVAALSHSEGWFRGYHSISLGDFVTESDLETRDEIVLIQDNELSIVDVVGSSLVTVRSEQLSGIPTDAVSKECWTIVQDINSDGIPEVIVRAKWSILMSTEVHTKYFVYDYAADDFISQREWTNTIWSTVAAVGSLPGGNQIAIPTNLSTSSYSPAWLVDPADLSDERGCTSNQHLDSDHVPFCVMADWSPPFGEPDRVIANTENQCYSWYASGQSVSGYPRVYSSQGTDAPPFPALGELDDQDVHLYADILAAASEGIVYGFSSEGNELSNLGFPYTLPSSIQGGFVVADIDRDGKVEVVFGTMDNYLHVWELGSCPVGYAPWSQCQHDAARTGVLVE